MPERVYEDDELAAFWRQGSTDYVLVTFGDAITLASGDRFFADVPAAKGDVTCLGIMTHRENWYPASAMRRLARAVAPLLSPYATRIGYGGSMGGYGAIKFSAVLGTSHTIALCPQWSIDRDECDGNDPGFQHWFRPYMAGHHIRPDEADGRVVLCFDPGDAIDRFHAVRLSEVVPSAFVIRMPMVGHHVTKAFAGTANLLELIAAVRNDDMPHLRMLAGRLRRQSAERAHNVLLRAATRHPVLAARAAHLPPATASSRLGRPSTFQLPLLASLLRRGREDEATALLHEIETGETSPEDSSAAALVVAQYAAACRRARIRVVRTHHDTVIVYDLLAGRIRHSRVPDHAMADAMLPVHLHLDEKGSGRFCLDLEGDRFWLRLTPDGRVRTVPARRLTGRAAACCVSPWPRTERVPQ